jgi:hypothetical protein
VKRALAVIAAVLMIAVAFFVRSRTSATSEAKRAEDGKITGTLVCAEELRSTCDTVKSAHPELEVRIEQASVTQATLQKASFSIETDKIDAWLTPKAYPAMVNENRSFSSLEPTMDEPSKVLARSPAVIVGFSDRMAALAKNCGVADDQLDWKCIGASAGQSWTDLDPRFTGSVKVGFPPPEQNASGLTVFAQASAEQLGRTDFASNDFGDASFQGWTSQLKRSITTPPNGRTPLDLMLSQGLSSIQVVGSLEAFAGPAVLVSRDKAKLKIIHPANVTTADVVVVPVRGSDKGGRVKQLLESGETGALLAKAGWRVNGQPAIDGVGNAPLPDSDGLPTPGALIALTQTWKDS